MQHRTALGDNIKIHFAGADNSLLHMVARNVANINYTLFTCYGFIANKTLKDDFTQPKDNLFVPRIIQPLRNHIIMDSGLFTLMFGAKKHEKQTMRSLMEWQDKTAKFVAQNNLTCTVVEIDCQKVLGVKEAWFFRNRMRKVIPKNRHINVFHLEDGKMGLDRLIEFSNYIAISVPEFRINRKGAYVDEVTRLANYIKNRKPEIDIHLLGCTQIELLKKNSFCTSSDSTSWLAANRYGSLKYGDYKTTKDITPQVRQAVLPAILSEYSKYAQYEKNGITKTKIKHITIVVPLSRPINKILS